MVGLYKLELNAIPRLQRRHFLSIWGFEKVSKEKKSLL